MNPHDDYYNTNKQPLPGVSSPYAQQASAPSGYPSPPAYSSQQYLGPDSRTNRPPANGSSPFDTVFDDNVYPVNSPQRSYTPSAQSSGSQHRDQYDYGRQPQDTGYYGSGALNNQNGRMGPNDDIPLQNNPQQPKDNDHVYDVNDPAQPGAGLGRNKSLRQKIRFGELGMLSSGKKKIAWVCWIFSIVQIAVFVGEIVRNATLTGSPIMIKPQFNPMIGPSTFVLVNMGSRYVACMHNVDGVQNANQSITWPCPNATTTDTLCSLSELCGFGGVAEPEYGNRTGQNGQPGPDLSEQPNQWFRFILPMFLHAGLIHIGFNLLLQLTIGREMEQSIGSLRFFLVYVSAGIFGFVLGGNFAATGISSTGASGSLFGVIALTLLDLLYSWRDRTSPVKDLMFILLDILISFVLGLLPGLDNFSHIGGFLMGLALGVCLLHSPNALRRRIGVDAPPYSTVMSGQSSQTAPPFLKNPIGFFKGRKPLWWAWWLIRAGALVLVAVVFILLMNNFYVDHKTCSWCKYLSCLPINGWCEMGNLLQTKS